MAGGLLSLRIRQSDYEKNIRESTNGLTMHLLLDLSRLVLGKPLPVHFHPLAVVAEILEN